MLYYLKKGKNATETQKRFVWCMEKVPCMIECATSGGNFMLEISLWMILQSDSPVEVDRDQIKTLRTNNIIPQGR